MINDLFTILYATNEWVIFTFTLVVYLLCIEIGFRLGKRTLTEEKSAKRSEITSIQAATLGLLALMLGFTFSMSITRFEKRKALIVQEANAIGTAYLRAGILNEPARSEMQSLLKEYLKSRLEYQRVGLDENKIADALRHSESLHQKLWSKALETAEKDPRFPVYSLIFPALNEVIDIHSERMEAAINHVPDLILYMIFLIASLSLALTGYVNGIERLRDPFATTILAIMIAAVTLVIIDLDRPRRGLIVEKETSLMQLHKSLNKPIQTNHKNS